MRFLSKLAVATYYNYHVLVIYGRQDVWFGIAALCGKPQLQRGEKRKQL